MEAGSALRAVADAIDTELGVTTWRTGGGTGTGTPVATQDEGTEVEDETTTYNFVGSGVTAVMASTGVVTVTVPGGGTPTPGGHARKAAISTDEALAQSEIDAGTSTTTQTVTMPTWTGGRRYLYIGVPEGEGDITGISTGGIDVFTSWEAVVAVIDAHKWWKTVDDQSDVASGAMYTITEA